MKKTEEICEYINGHFDQIIDNLKYESIEVYKFIQYEFLKGNIENNYLFQFVYRSYYRLDNAGLTEEFKREYFKLLEENRGKAIFDYEHALKRLYKFKNRKDQESFQFSFVTKLFNTIDNNIPIYDSEVVKVFGLSKYMQRSFDIKFKKYLNQLEAIKNAYKKIIDERLLENTINRFNQKFIDSNLTEMKRLDFIFWSAGKIIREKELIGEESFLSLEELDKIDKSLES